MCQIWGQFVEGGVSGKISSNRWKSDTLEALFLSVLKSSCGVNIESKEVKIIQLLKQDRQTFLRNKEPIETDKKKNVGDNTKEDFSENSEKKLKDISNTDK